MSSTHELHDCRVLTRRKAEIASFSDNWVIFQCLGMEFQDILANRTAQPRSLD